ncbi:unnamed protein product [Cochlearia groenlandica]
MVVPLSHVPPSPQGFYAVNNQFLTNGPKGFTEFKMLENQDMFIRIDFPGVPETGVRVMVDPTKKAVSVFADAPKEHKHDSSPRHYGSATGLVCKCCEISGVVSHMSDGVLRLILSKTHTKSDLPSCISFLGGGANREDKRGTGPHGTDPHDPALTGPVLKPHPNVLQGCVMSHEYKPLENGGLYVRLDMPGVPKDGFTVSVDEEDGRVKVTGVAPAVDHDFDGRFYSGHVALLADHVPRPGRRIKTIVKNGVIRLLIPSV